MAHVIKDRVKQTCTAPSTTDPFDFTGSATATGFQAFVDALANGDTCMYVASDSSGNWETGLGTWTEASDQLARTTILASSNSGSAETFSGTVTVAIIMPARDVESAYKEARGMIRGLELSWSSTTAIAVASGFAAINGKLMTYAGATLTSGSTMKDIANSTVTIGASKAYFVFLYDNAGTAEIRIEERDGTGDGADPTWDSDADYWKAASTGLAARRIGKFWTNGSSQIIQFYQSSRGLRARVFRLNSQTGLVLLSGGTSTTYASITITPYITADDEFVLAIIRAGTTSGSAVTTAGRLAVDGGTSDHYTVQGYFTNSGSFIPGGECYMPNTGTLHYKGSGTSPSVNVDLVGYEHIV